MRPPSTTPRLVSVVLIFLNEERHLAEAIASVRAQDYPHWELLLVDDGSTDRSPEIARVAAEGDARIRCLAHPGGVNRGMSASRNLGLSAAQGEYVAFLDADDIYLPQRLSRHVEVLERHPSLNVAASSYLRCFPNDSGAIDCSDVVSARPFFVVGDVVWTPPHGLLVVTQVPYLNLGTFSITVRRHVADVVGGFEDAFRTMYEDQVFATKLLARESVYLIQAYLACYRHHGESVTQRSKDPRIADESSAVNDTQRFLRWQLGYLESQGIDDSLILTPIRARLSHSSRPETALSRLKAAVRAAAKSALEMGLPRAGFRWLVRTKFLLDGVLAQVAYSRLTRATAARERAAIFTRERT